MWQQTYSTFNMGRRRRGINMKPSYTPAQTKEILDKVLFMLEQLETRIYKIENKLGLNQ